MATGRVHFGCDRETAFDYLVDPHHRPEWQSSLRRVSAVAGEPRVGQTWVDETKPGLHAQMRTTELVRPERWSETGTWRSVGADLTLVFHEAPDGCDVDFSFRIHALGPVGAVASLLSKPAVAADLRRAAARLARLAG